MTRAVPLVVQVLELYTLKVTHMRQKPRIFYYALLDLGQEEHVRIHISRQAYLRLGGIDQPPEDPRQRRLPNVP